MAREADVRAEARRLEGIADLVWESIHGNLKREELRAAVVTALIAWSLVPPQEAGRSK